ncbi:MAG TPA: CRISPR-associated endonuclease Cas2 [Candidatus Woesebacteria bacterium]|jgi:CRISPR-associated protein Cas2|nr:CRISPR-associated endonuclease Cas2 [Candidatus Woesebacteria bacterium]
MLIVAYDFSNDKTRASFSKYLKKFGEKIQYSVYGIKNSPRVLNNILSVIEHKYKKKFKKSDSILLFSTCQGCSKKIIRYGNAVHYEEDVVELGE